MEKDKERQSIRTGVKLLFCLLVSGFVFLIACQAVEPEKRAYPQVIGIDWQKDSYDGGDHLNLSGAEKVTDYLGKYLRDNYHFRENYSDETLRRWNAGMKKYQDAASSV